MERDIILADEAINFRIGVIPPALPSIWLAYELRPFNAGREVAHHSFEPHIQAFVFPTIQRHADAPINIACNGSSTQAVLHKILAEARDVRPPMVLMFSEILQNLLTEGRQI